MVWIDYTIVGVVIFSALIGWMRGVLREVLSFGTWLFALVVAWFIHRQISELLIAQIAQPPVRIAIAFAGVFFVTLIIGTIIGALVIVALKKTGLTRFDQWLGFFFGVGRGFFTVAMIVFLTALTPLPNTAWWKESVLIGHVNSVAYWLLARVPVGTHQPVKQI